MFLKNKNIIFKIRRSKVTDYAALKENHQVEVIEQFLAKFAPLRELLKDSKNIFHTAYKSSSDACSNTSSTVFVI